MLCFHPFHPQDPDQQNVLHPMHVTKIFESKVPTLSAWSEEESDDESVSLSSSSFFFNPVS